MGNVPYASVSDPLSLGASLVQCIDEGGLGGGELQMVDLDNATGGFRQGNARKMVDQGTVRYNPLGTLACAGGTATIASTAAVAVGDTKGGYFVISVKPAKTNSGHDALDVSVRKHKNVDLVDTAVS